MRSYSGTRPVVAVKINGAGPYDLLVDTGATATVLDASLFQQLGLQAEGSTAVSSNYGSDGQNYSTAREISVGGLAVEDLRVLSLKSMPFSSGYRGVRGILGENFLRHFDILIDNRRRNIVLDAGTGLAESLSGERLPITFPVSANGEVRYAPMVSVRVEGVGSNVLTVLLDSGADDLSVDTTRATQWRTAGQCLQDRNCQRIGLLLHVGRQAALGQGHRGCHQAGVVPSARAQWTRS
jgi:hypothetical protein